MWEFPQYTSRKRAFNGLSWGFSKAAGAGAGAGAGARAGVEVGAGARASRIALRIRCKSFLEYLEILVVAMGDFGPGSPLGCLKNSNLGGREKLGGVTERVTERATEGVTEGCS